MSLPVGEKTEAGRGRVPVGFLGMLVLVLIGELLISGTTLDLVRPEYWMWYASGRSAHDDVKDAEVLCLGTSQTSYGVVPQVLEERLGRRTYNLAMCSSPPPADYYLLKRALDAGARPKVVVLDLHPHLIHASPRNSLQFFPNLLSVREAIDMGWTSSDPDFTVRVLIAKAFPTILNRPDLRTAVMAALNGKDCSLRKLTLMNLWNRIDNQGAMVLPPRADPNFELSQNDYAWSVPDCWYHDPINTRYIRRLLRLAAAHDISVFLLLPPIDSRLQKLRWEQGLSRSFKTYVSGIQARHENLVVIDGETTGYPSSVFSDGMHVSRPGAVALTSDLGEILRPYFTADPSHQPRWVTLPAYRPRDTRAAIVNLVETKNPSLPWKVAR